MVPGSRSPVVTETYDRQAMTIRDNMNEAHSSSQIIEAANT